MCDRALRWSTDRSKFATEFHLVIAQLTQLEEVSFPPIIEQAVTAFEFDDICTTDYNLSSLLGMIQRSRVDGVVAEQGYERHLGHHYYMRDMPDDTAIDQETSDEQECRDKHDLMMQCLAEGIFSISNTRVSKVWIDRKAYVSERTVGVLSYNDLLVTRVPNSTTANKPTRSQLRPRLSSSMAEKNMGIWDFKAVKKQLGNTRSDGKSWTAIKNCHEIDDGYTPRPEEVKEAEEGW